MRVDPFRTPGLGDQTYLWTHDGVGVLVDPQRDVDRFLAVADERDVEIRFVLETHLHNDYVSGGVDAARRTGAELVVPAAAAPAYGVPGAAGGAPASKEARPSSPEAMLCRMRIGGTPRRPKKMKASRMSSTPVNCSTR